MWLEPQSARNREHGLSSLQSQVTQTYVGIGINFLSLLSDL
jgi:hypothetical protein